MSLPQLAKDIKRRSELLAEVVSAGRTLLWNAPEAEEHLAYIRGRLTDSEIKDADIGYFPENHQCHLLFDYISESTLNELNLLYNATIHNRGQLDVIRKSIFHYHNLIIPFGDEYGNIITLAGRTILSEGRQRELKVPKYKNAPFKRQMHLFGLDKSKNAIEAHDGVIIVEGQIDCIKCHANGFLNTVALTGSDLTMQQVFLLKRKTNNFFLLLDNDTAGEKAIKKILSNYSEFANIHIVPLPAQYNDVDDYLTKSESHSVLSNLCRA